MLKKMGVSTNMAVRHLGLDYAAGKKCKPVVWQTGQKEAKRRKQRILSLGLPRKAKVRMLRTSLLPVADFGATVYGLSDAEIDGLCRRWPTERWDRPRADSPTRGWC